MLNILADSLLIAAGLYTPANSTPRQTDHRFLLSRAARAPKARPCRTDG